MEGDFRLKFTLFEMLKDKVVNLNSIMTDTFTVFAVKNFPGMSESTFISRSFGDQGVRLRIRKEPRTLLGKRPTSSDDTRPYPSMPMDSRLPGPNYTPQSVGSYVPSPGQDYHALSYGEPHGKRMRTSIDAHSSFERDSQYVQRQFTEQQAPYNTYTSQVPTTTSLSRVGYYPGPHSAPPVMPEYSFRQPQTGSSSNSSPYDSSSSQVAGRSLSGINPNYHQTPRYTTQPHSHQRHDSASSQTSVSQLSDPPPPIRQQHSQQQHHYPTHYSPNPSQQPSTYFTGYPTVVNRASVGQLNYPASALPLASPGVAMPPPFSQGRNAFQQQQQYQQSQQQQQSQQAFTLLPPLQSSGAQVPSSPSVVEPIMDQPPQAVASTSLPHTGQQARYMPGPPTSFDSAAQQTGPST
ncbi:MAG: hypothetical protein M1836_002551 [Candelina mexicana]|nr:MAG: hypothetical protein M1836_002551 [Candelina mexicana]